MTTLPLWLKLALGTVSIFILALLGFNLNGIQLSSKTEKIPQETPKPIPTPVTSNPALETVEIKIIVRNAMDKEPIEDVKVRLIVSNGSPETERTDEGGYAIFTIKKSTKPRILITKKGFKGIDKILNETINLGEVKPYYLEPKETDTSINTFRLPLVVAEKPKSSPLAKKPFPSIKPLPIIETPKSSPLAEKPLLTIEKPKTSPKDNINSKQAFNQTIVNQEFELLKTYTIEIFF